MKSAGKQWISLSLLSLMLIKVWVIPLLYLDFEIRRDYIVANLCENRNRPQLHCDGKCFLAKRLAALNEHEKRQAEKNYMAQLLDHVMDTRKAIYTLPAFISFEKRPVVFFRYVIPFAAQIAPAGIFHPPLA